MRQARAKSHHKPKHIPQTANQGAEVTRSAPGRVIPTAGVLAGARIQEISLEFRLERCQGPDRRGHPVTVEGGRANCTSSRLIPRATLMRDSLQLRSPIMNGTQLHELSSGLKREEPRSAPPRTIHPAAERALNSQLDAFAFNSWRRVAFPGHYPVLSTNPWHASGASGWC
jgi:hypothetical protein